MHPTHTDGMTQASFPFLKHLHILQEEIDIGIILLQLREYSHILPKEIRLTFKFKPLAFQPKVVFQGIYLLTLCRTHALHLSAKRKGLAWTSTAEKVRNTILVHQFSHIDVRHRTNLHHVGKVLLLCLDCILVYLATDKAIHIHTKFLESDACTTHSVKE